MSEPLKVEVKIDIEQLREIIVEGIRSLHRFEVNPNDLEMNYKSNYDEMEFSGITIQLTTNDLKEQS
jgi:hypothetical protein